MKILNYCTFLLVLFSLLSCNLQKQLRTVSCNKIPDYEYLTMHSNGTMCTMDTCAMYQSIWKDLIMEKNNLTESYFTDHIELVQSHIDTWNDGVSFSICYMVKIDWAIAYACDQFIVKIDKDNQLYPTVNVPRGVYLTKYQIRLVVNNRAFSSGITKLSNTEKLKFNSMTQALNNLIQKAKINTLCSNFMTIYSLTGDMTLVARAQYDNEVNSCIVGQIDLLTGEAVVSDVPCVIF